jgi:hypothetical protein
MGPFHAARATLNRDGPWSQIGRTPRSVEFYSSAHGRRYWQLRGSMSEARSGCRRRSGSSTVPSRLPARDTRQPSMVSGARRSCLCLELTTPRSSSRPIGGLRWPVAAVLASGGLFSPLSSSQRLSTALPAARPPKSCQKAKAKRTLLRGPEK